MSERIEAIIDALRSMPEDAFGCVPDTPDRQGWWIRDELIDSACKVREEVERLQEQNKRYQLAWDALSPKESTRLSAHAYRKVAEAQEDGDG